MSKPNSYDLLKKIVDLKDHMSQEYLPLDYIEAEKEYRTAFSDLYDNVRNDSNYPTNTDILIKDFYLCRGQNGGFTYHISKWACGDYYLDVFNGISGKKIASYNLTQREKVL